MRLSIATAVGASSATAVPCGIRPQWKLGLWVGRTSPPRPEKRHRIGVGHYNAASFCTNALAIVVVLIITLFPFTSVGCFSTCAQDYNITEDIASGEDTPVVYAWSSGEGISMYYKSQRGSVQLNFTDGTLTSVCEASSDYYALHGALLLVAWLIVAPYGIYQAR